MKVSAFTTPLTKKEEAIRVISRRLRRKFSFMRFIVSFCKRHEIMNNPFDLAVRVSLRNKIIQLNCLLALFPCSLVGIGVAGGNENPEFLNRSSQTRN